MYSRTTIVFGTILIFAGVGFASGLTLTPLPITDLTCDLKIEFNHSYIGYSTAIFAKVFAKQQDRFLLFVYWHEPYEKPSIFPFEPVGLALLKDGKIMTRYQLLNTNRWKEEVPLDVVGNVQLNVSEMHTMAVVDSVLQHILSIDLTDFSREVLPGETRLTHQHGGAVLWRHKISAIRCWFSPETGCLERAEYYNIADDLVCELQGLNPMRLLDNSWTPTETIMTLKEGQLWAYNSDLTLTVHSEGHFEERRAEAKVSYPPGGVIIHRYFKIFDNSVLLPAETKLYTGNHELIARSVFNNYQINTSLDDEVFDEKHLLAGAGLSGARGDLFRAKVSFAAANRSTGDAPSYGHILPVVESLTSSVNTSVAINARYEQIKLLISQGKYAQAIEPIMKLLELAASEEEYGARWAGGTAHGLADKFIKGGQIDLAQDILDKYVEYKVKSGWDLSNSANARNFFQNAKLNLKDSKYFHAIKLFEYISQNAMDIETKAFYQFATACCYDMIARESIDTSTWYQTDAEKMEAVNKALRHYEAFIAKYPESQYAPWATHFSQFLAVYPPATKFQNAYAPTESIEKQAGEIMSNVRQILHTQRPQWTDAQIETYAKNVHSVFERTLHRVLTQEESNDFQNSFTVYCQSALPERLDTVDAFAIELITIRWAVRQYAARLDLASEGTEVAVDWQVERLIERFDEFIATYLYDDRLKKEIAAAKKDYREILNLYCSNVLYSVLKYPLSPRLLILYEDAVRERETNYQRRFSANKRAATDVVKRSKNPRIKGIMNEWYLRQKISNLQAIARLFAKKIARAHKTIFPDEFHPEDPTKKRVIQYHYLPNKGIKLTLLVNKEDYPKLGIE